MLSGAADREGVEAINDKGYAVRLIRKQDAEVVPVGGLSITVGGGGGNGWLSLQGQGLAKKFGVEGKGTSLGQLIARDLAPPIMELFLDGQSLGFLELPESKFRRDFDERRKRGKHRLVGEDLSESFVQVNKERWLQVLGAVEGAVSRGT